MTKPSSHSKAGKRSRASLDHSALPNLSIEELRELWALHMGRSRPPVQRYVLARELAWRTQARVHGGIDPATQRLLARAMRDAVRAFSDRRGLAGLVDDTDREAPKVTPAATSQLDLATPTDPVHPTRRRTQGAKMPSLPVGTRLVRAWGGRQHEVFAIENGQFLYNGKVFTNLSTIAETITGSNWSGPRFFGVRARASRSKERNK